MRTEMREILIILVVLTGVAVIAEEPAPGHSAHGEVFNEGPRQAAVLIEGTGEVSIKISTSSRDSQLFFNQGLGQLHGFWDFEAERSFRQAASFDPDCAMNYWGMAMANFKNDTRGKQFIEEAVARKESATELECLWIDGLAAYYKDTKLESKKRLREFVRSLEKIATKYPEEIEAQAFLLKQIYYNHGKGLTIPSHYAINLLANQILTAHPDHPANHYQIHLWDREDAAKALTAAANCGPAAPGIAHMWHMPGHIYSKLHRYRDSAWQQEASARVDHAHMIRYRIIPDRIHNFAHNNEWLIRNLNSLGEVDRSIELARNMISLPRLAKFKKEDDESTYESKGSSWAYGRVRLRDTLIRFELWDDFIHEATEGQLVIDEDSISQNDYDRFLSIAYYEKGDRESAQTHRDAVADRLEEKKTKRDEAVSKAEKKAKDGGKGEKEIKTAKEAAAKNFKKDIEALEAIHNELSAYHFLTLSEPDFTAALEILPKLKNLSKSRHAMLWHRAGDREKAKEKAEEAVKDGKNQVLPLLAQIRILHANGEIEAAKEAFETFRTVASTADVDAPIFSSLPSLAADLGFPADWKKPPGKAEDLGARPRLDDLGPFRWSPPSAPGISLTDTQGKRFVPDFERPTLLIFYLGKGCEHCMEQLNKFAPAYDKFDEAGIDIIAVSTDSVEGLRKTFRAGEKEENPFPFPLLSDQSLAAFRDFRAYDDFESQPLHGTFLIDPSQRIRWQNISYEPFMHPDWLLEECRRLLRLDVEES